MISAHPAARQRFARPVLRKVAGREPGPHVAAVLLAAGESTRMNEMKALLPWTSGKSLIAHQAQALGAADYSPVVVVLGHLADRLRQEIEGQPVIIVENPRYRRGRTTSVVAGIGALPSSVDALLIVSVDQPRSVELLRTLREWWSAARSPIAVPSLDGRPGHPPLFSASLLPELCAISEARQGLREVVSRHRNERLLVPVEDPLTLVNLNTREEYDAAKAAVSRGGRST